MVNFLAGLENSSRPLVFTSVSGCRASEYFDISTENLIFPMYANKFCDAGQVPIFRYFEACLGENSFEIHMKCHHQSPGRKFT